MRGETHGDPTCDPACALLGNGTVTHGATHFSVYYFHRSELCLATSWDSSQEKCVGHHTGVDGTDVTLCGCHGHVAISQRPASLRAVRYGESQPEGGRVAAEGPGKARGALASREDEDGYRGRRGDEGQ